MGISIDKQKAILTLFERELVRVSSGGEIEYKDVNAWGNRSEYHAMRRENEKRRKRGEAALPVAPVDTFLLRWVPKELSGGNGKYLLVCFTLDGLRLQIPAASLVCLWKTRATFDPCEYAVGYIDGDYQNIHPDNIALFTFEEIRKRVRGELITSGMVQGKKPLVRLTREQAEEVRSLHKKDPRPTHKALAEQYNVSEKSIYRALAKHTFA